MSGTEIVLGDDERAFVARARAATLVARRRDGSPTGWPMTPLWPGDGWLYFNTYRAAAKATMMQRDGRVATVLTDPAAQACLLQADAELVTDAAELEWLVEYVLRDDGFVPADVIARTQDRLRRGKRVLFRMRPRRLEALVAPTGWRTEEGSRATPAGERRDSGRAGRDRSTLELDDAERAQFIAHSRHAVVGWIDPTGYPRAMVVPLSGPGGDRLEVGPPRPPAGTAVCVVVDRGASYQDIMGAIVHGTLGERGELALDDVVSFSFAKGQP